MAVVKSPNGIIQVASGIHLVHVGTEPREIPNFLLEAAIALGCIEVKQDKPVSRTTTKQTVKSG